MNGLPADLIIYIVVAVVLVIWLRNTLGTRHGDERQRPNPFTQNDTQKPAGINDGNIFEVPPLSRQTEDLLMQFTLPRNVSLDEVARAGLSDILRADRSFDLSRFVTNAQDAYAIVIEAFAAGDRETLRDLLTPEVYAGFEGVINGRGDIDISTEVQSTRQCRITEATLNKNVARIALHFTGDAVHVERDGEGNVIAGNPDRIVELVDEWVFSRDLSKSDPVWRVCETRDAAEHPIPNISETN